MVSRLLLCAIAGLSMLCPAATFAAATPYPPYPGARPSVAYQVAVDGQSVFVHNFLTYDQFNWMDHASFAMTGKVRVTVANLVSERKLITCNVRPLAYGIQPKISGNTCSFDLDRPRYLVIFLNEEALFHSSGLLLFAEPPEKDPVKLGDPKVVNIMDYKVDNTGKTLETVKINQAISEVSAKPGGGVLFFPAGIYLSGTVLVKSNVKLYVDAGAVIRGSTRSSDYPVVPSPAGERQLRAFIVFNGADNAGLAGRGAIDMDGYPRLWHDFQPDTSDGKARDPEGKVLDPRGNGIRGYIINNSRNITFEDLLLLRSAYWTVNVFNSENFSTHRVKIVNRKQQYHDDAYDFSGSSHILIEDGFAMTMDDTFALYGGGGGAGRAGIAAPRGIEDLVVKGFVNYTYTSALAVGYGSAPPVKHLRFEDVHFISTHNKFAVWIQLTPAYFTGRGYASGSRSSKSAVLDDFQFVNCSFENDGGHIYIDGGENALTNFVFENCTFHKTTKPSLLTGKNVTAVTFKKVKVNGVAIKDAEQLQRAGVDLTVPTKFAQ